MVRVEKTFDYPFSDSKNFKQKIFSWVSKYNSTFIFLDSNPILDSYSEVEFIAAFGVQSTLKTNGNNSSFEDLKNFQKRVSDYIFGHLSYDLKNELEDLDSGNPSFIDTDDLYFFQPQKIVIGYKENLKFLYLKNYSNDLDKDFDEIKAEKFQILEKDYSVKVTPQITFEEYKKQFEKVKEYINKGKVYEINYCQEFVAKTSINPLNLYFSLKEKSNAPFSAFYSYESTNVLCFSPERYLKKSGRKIISQPIKGTKPTDNIALNLSKSIKDRVENTMITDLVRNDLSKIAKRGSVNVDEFLKVYSFKQTHQMISTISAILSTRYDAFDVIKETFPMGSMTGAPKVSAMNIIEEVEDFKRGIYSGAIGYFTPNLDFDFNVVIRTLIYDNKEEKLSVSAGGAITFLSELEDEYEECLTKLKFILDELNPNWKDLI